MSFCGHEIHVGVDCFSVEPLGLRPRGSLFLPPCFYSPKHGNSNWRSKSDLKSLSWVTLYFSNSFSACSLAISVDILPASTHFYYPPEDVQTVQNSFASILQLHL